MEQATEKILKSAEVIEDGAKALAAAMKTDYERGLAQEIQDHVVKIYEACNFQDLSGQRIGHVIETLTMIEDQVEGMLDRHQSRPCDRPAAKPDGSETSAQRSPARRRLRPHQPARHRHSVRLAHDPGKWGPVCGKDHAHKNYAGRLISIKQTRAAAAKPAASASAAASVARSTTNAITSGAAACTSRNGPASRPISRP